MKALDYLKELESNGYKAYIVGGYVRGNILGIDTDDVDITTSATPEQVRKIFNIDYCDKVGSIKIKDGNLNIDITTMRKEGHYILHRPQHIKFIDDLKTDLKRRDFTINGICMDARSNIVDLLNGKDDLDNKIIRVIGGIKSKFSEDPLRMVRALRFAIVYDFSIEEKALFYILRHKSMIRGLSHSRKREELERIFTSSRAREGLELLNNLDLLWSLGVSYSNTPIITSDVLGIWAQLDYDDEFQFTKSEAKTIFEIRKIVSSNKMDEITLYDYGFKSVSLAGEILGISKDKIKKMYDKMPIKCEKDLAITNLQIIKIIGKENVRKVKFIKRDLTEKVVSGNLTNEEKSMSKYINKNWK